MKAVRLHAVGDLRPHEEDEPAPPREDGWTRVEVTAVGICGSDLHWFGEGAIGDAVLERPLVLGHEVAGTATSGPLAGRAVAVDPAITCRACDWCLAGSPNLCPHVRFAGHGSTDGGLREVLWWPTRLLHPVPEQLTPPETAALEPLGVALHAVDHAGLGVGDTVAVVGCGPIGLLLVRLARLAGAHRVIAVDPLEHRRAAASAWGADEVVDPHEAGDGVSERSSSAHVVFEVSGEQPAVDTSLDLVRIGGRVVLVGIPSSDATAFRASTARRKGLTLVLSRRMGDVYPRCLRLATTVVDLAAVVSDVVPLADCVDAFSHAAARHGLKTVVEVSSSRAPSSAPSRPG